MCCCEEEQSLSSRAVRQQQQEVKAPVYRVGCLNIYRCLQATSSVFLLVYSFIYLLDSDSAQLSRCPTVGCKLICSCASWAGDRVSVSSDSIDIIQRKNSCNSNTRSQGKTSAASSTTEKLENIKTWKTWSSRIHGSTFTCDECTVELISGRISS